MIKFSHPMREKKRRLGWGEKERVGSATAEERAEQVRFQKFVREQLLKLKEKGLSIPIATL